MGELHAAASPTDRPRHEALAKLLSERYGVEVASSAPAWTAEYSLKSEDDARGVVAATEHQIAQLAAERDELQAQFELIRGHKEALLSGTDAEVENAARWAFEQLGATYESTPTRRADDGRFARPGRASLRP